MSEATKNIPIFRKLAQGQATPEEREFYMRTYADETEKRLNKTCFEFTAEEEMDWRIMSANAQEGDLHKTDGTGYFCRECKNKGYIAVKCEGLYAERDCKCMNIRKALNQVKWSGLGDIFGKCTFKSFTCTQQWQALMKDKAIEFLTSDSTCFFVGGKSGAGKSHICTAIVGQLLKRGLSLNYMQWLDVVDDLNNTRYRQVERYEEIMNDLKNVEVLYIDDFLKGDNTVKPSSADIKLAYRIINARYVKSRADTTKRYITVISSEWLLSQIDGFDTATAGRIKEMAQNFVIRLEGADKNQRRFAAE